MFISVTILNFSMKINKIKQILLLYSDKPKKEKWR